MRITWPMKLESRTNQREHWSKQWRRDKHQKDIVRQLLLTKRLELPHGPWDIFLIRIKPEDRRVKFLDSDNLQASFKAIRDQVADWLGIDDGDESAASWNYSQETGPEYAIEVEIATR